MHLEIDSQNTFSSSIILVDTLLCVDFGMAHLKSDKLAEQEI
jgi:hypothetical protein